MGGGVFDDLRRQLLADETGEPFRQPHAHAPDAVRAQADGRGEHERRAIGLEQIDRAHVGVERALNQLDDVAERFFGMSAVRDEVADFFEGPEERVALCRHAAEHSKNGAANVSRFHVNNIVRVSVGRGDIYVHEVSTGPLLP